MKITRTRTARTLLTGLLLTVFSAPGFAAEPGYYQVEMIVFENLRSPQDGERWPVTPGYPDTDQAVDLLAEPEVPAPAEKEEAAATLPANNEPLMPPAEEAPVVTPPPATYRMVAEDQLRIADVFSRLKRSSSYKPLLHLGWVQSADEDETPLPVRVMLSEADAVDSLNARQVLDGRVIMRKSRFIHIDVDLAYFLPPAVTSVADNQVYASLVRLQEKRKMRLDELHYLDHPLFGVILYVSPVITE